MASGLELLRDRRGHVPDAVLRARAFRREPPAGHEGGKPQVYILERRAPQIPYVSDQISGRETLLP